MGCSSVNIKTNLNKRLCNDLEYHPYKLAPKKEKINFIFYIPPNQTMEKFIN